MASPLIGNTSKQTPECSDSEESSLCLSCGSSPFVEDDASETNKVTGNLKSVQINPYQLSPMHRDRIHRYLRHTKIKTMSDLGILIYILICDI